jgi:hypothetical protein
MFKNQNLSVYGGPGQNEWEASGSAFSSLREKKHGAQLNHGHAQKRDVPFRPLNFSLFRFFCFKTKEMKSLPGLRAKRILLALPSAGGTSFFPAARLPAGRLKKGSIPMAIGSRAQLFSANCYRKLVAMIIAFKNSFTSFSSSMPMPVQPGLRPLVSLESFIRDKLENREEVSEECIPLW